MLAVTPSTSIWYGMLAVVGRQGPQAVRGQELALVEQLGQEPLQPVRAGQAEQQPLVARLPAQHARSRAACRGRHRPSRPRKSANCLPSVSACRRSSSLDDRGGEHRDDADHRADLHRHRVPGRRDEPVVVEAVGLVPQALAGPARRGWRRSARGTSAPGPRRAAGRTGSARWRWRPGRSRRRPSSRWRRTAPGCRRPAGASGRAGRCCPGRGSRPRRRCCPPASSRLTHQVKLTSSLSKTRDRKSRSRPPSMANTSSAAHACTGGFTSPKSHS